MPDQTPQNTELATKSTIAMNGHGLELRTLDDAWRFATMIARSGMAPKDFNSPDKIMVAMQHGAELGLGYMQSLHAIAVINGRPALWGDALPALVYGSGKCRYIKESTEGSGDGYVAICEAARKDNESQSTVRFGVDDAKAAGLWGKAGPWKQYPKRMLQMRARSFCLRDLFADVLRGIAVADEVRDYQPVTVQQSAPDTSENHVSVDDDPILSGEQSIAEEIKELEAQEVA